MTTQEQLEAAKQAIDATMIRVEDRLPRAENEEEKTLLRSGYAKLVDLLYEVVLNQLSSSAASISKATQGLQGVIESASTDPLEVYIKKLRESVKQLGAKPPLKEVVEKVEEDNNKVKDLGSEIDESVGASAWKELISVYKNDHVSSDALKIASLSQWIIESGRGASALAKKHLNFGGLKYRKRMEGYAIPVTYTGTDMETTEYCKFQSVQAFIDGYWHFIRSGPYGDWGSFADDAEGYIRQIGPKYAGDPDYVNKVIGVFEEAKDLLEIEIDELGSGGLPDVNDDTKLAIVIGHNAVSQGAYAKEPMNASEFMFNGRVAEQMLKQAQHFNVTAKVFSRVKHPQGYIKEITIAYEKVKGWGPDVIIELHFNSSSSSSSTGTENLFAENSQRGSMLAKAVVGEVYDVLGLKLRHDGGIKGIVPGQRGWRSVSAIPSVPSILAEPFFGSNPNDRNRISTIGEHQLALAYLRGVRNFAGQDQ